jgi:amidohydrolase
MSSLLDQARELFDYSRALRRDFHRHPELGFKEVRTAGIIARELSALGLEVTTGVAQTGVVAVLEGAQPGPVVLARFDMDALPIQEANLTDYVSETSGVMHACGHDGHVAVGLTVARMLAAQRGNLRGVVKFIFQPAEEGMGGAERMIDAGVLENPRVDTALALHLWNERPVGWVGVTSGPLMAGADVFSARIEGRGGHGAIPHEAIDPLTAAAQIVTALQTIVSRNTSPLDTAVVSVCRLHAGDAFNVIPQSAELGGTFRTYDSQVRARLVERFEAIVQGIASAMGCEATTQIQRLTPAVMNDPLVTARVFDSVTRLGELNVEAGFRSMVSEDMAFLLEKVPGCYMMVGSANPEKGLAFGHHHPRFDFDEDALPNAAAVMAAAVMEMLGEGNE